MIYKKCKKCNRELPIDSFYTWKRTKITCKDCISKYHTKKYIENIEKKIIPEQQTNIKEGTTMKFNCEQCGHVTYYRGCSWCGHYNKEIALRTEKKPGRPRKYSMEGRE